MQHSHRRRALGAFVVLVVTLGLLTVGSPPTGAAPTDLLISEYVEGSSNNKALEVQNTTGAPVDLAAGEYTLRIYFNGSATAAVNRALTGTLVTDDVLVLAHTQASSEILAVTDVATNDMNFNGDDAIVLTKGGTPGTVVDSIGQVGVDPGTEWGTGPASTQDNTLRRPASNEVPDTDPSNAYDPAATFTGYAIDTVDGLGLPGDETAEPPEPELRTIGEVQGAVADDADGHAHRSSFAPASGNATGDLVTVRGIVTELSRAGNNRGFWLQEPAADSDGDPRSSDGIFVFHGSSTTVDGHTPAVGDDLTVTARVSEYFFATQLSGTTDVVVNATGVAVPAAVEADPPEDVVDAGRYWERLEGMQVTIPAGAVTTSGRAVFASSNDSEIWMIRGDDPLAAREDPYARRTFRDAHPLDAQPGEFDDGNGQRMLIGPQGVKAGADDPTTLLPPVRTFSTLDGAVTGAVNYSFEKYRVEVAAMPSFTEGVDPTANGAPQAPDRDVEYSVGSINVENLYDLRDDPTDGCDFPGNSGCPGVSPPFDYVPATEQVYQDRLTGLSIQIREDLHAPDVVGVQEAEDQDICSVDGPALTCGGAEAGDGRPDTLQELALRIAADGGPIYQVASDRDGADDRGIHSGFLFRTDRVALVEPTSGDPILGSEPGITYRGAALPANADVQNPKALNAVLPGDVDTSTGVDGSDVYTRAAQTGRFAVYQETVGEGEPVDLWVVNNHFSSGPDGRIGQRTEQAAYAAAIAETVEVEVPGARVMVAGDLNVFPRPDDPVPPSAGGPSDQLGPLYDAGLASLWEVLAEELPASAYTYVFEGQAQTLGQQFAGAALLDDLVETRVAHVNSDFGAESSPATGRGVSDHDPLVTRFAFPGPPVPQLDDEAFVRQQFADLVGRAPTASELEVYVEALGDGSVSRARFVDNLRRIAYDPSRAPVIRLYTAALGRRADRDGVEYWTARARAGLSLRQMARYFVGSSEFRTTYGDLDDGAFVDLVYQNVLGRAPDAEGRAYWVGRLAAGMSRAELMVYFSESVENRNRARPSVDASEIYFALLGRTPTASEQAAATARTVTLADRLALIDEILTSEEYAVRVGLLPPPG